LHDPAGLTGLKAVGPMALMLLLDGMIMTMQPGCNWDFTSLADCYRKPAGLER
jgi:hypothetical protein